MFITMRTMTKGEQVRVFAAVKDAPKDGAPGVVEEDGSEPGWCLVRIGDHPPVRLPVYELPDRKDTPAKVLAQGGGTEIEGVRMLAVGA